MLKEIWKKITQRFPEFGVIPLIIREQGQVGYMPEIDGKPWGIFLKEDMRKWFEDQFFIRYFIAKHQGVPVETISDEELALFVLLHEVGHHQHVLQYAEEGKSGYDWWMAYMNAYWEYEGELDQQYALSGILSEEYEMQLYRAISFEQFADEYAFQKITEFSNYTQSIV